ncbi:MAG: PAS domain S-box protein, partial [Desulfobacteraceae bacterium]|nr:PAS domain S-box protein [Desulfobacteraceae bacterium]
MRNKLRLGFLVIIGLFWVICIHTLLSSTGLKDSFVRLNDHVFPTIIEMNQMNTQLNEVREVTLAYILLGDAPDVREASRQQLEELYQSVGQFAAKYLAHGSVVERARGDAEKLASLSQELILASSDTTRLKDEGAEYRELHEKMETDFEPIFWSLKGLLEELAAEHQEELLITRARVSDRHNTIIRLVLLLGIIGTLVAMIIAVLVDRYLARYLAERKKMEKALQESEAKWRSIVENSPDIIMLVGADYSILFINRTIGGLRRKEVIGTCVYDYIPDKYKSRVKECHERVLKTGNPGQYETDYQTIEGEVLHFEARVGPVKQSGKIVGITVSTRDITQRKKMEKALEKERPDLGERVKELDCLHGISRLIEIENISSEEILEGTVNLIPPSCQYPEVAASRIILEGQTFKTKNFKETPWKLASDIMVGGKRTGLLQVIYLEERPESDEGPFLKEERNLVNAIAQRLGRIIEHKRMEIDLRIKEEAIASSVNAIILADLEGNLNYVNRSFLHMWGYSDEKEVLGKSVTELWNAQDMALDVIEAVRSNRSWMGELVARRKDDSVFDVQLLANIVENEAGKAICMMASVIDITERKKIEQMKSDFVALASHELRTPLTSIQGYTELILDGDVGEISREQKEFLEIISQNTRRLEALINDVLDVEKIESGRMTMRREKVDLSQIVDNCANTFKVMAEGKGLQLQKDVKTSPMNVLGDYDRLSQVLSNLLSNAIKYTKEGRVKISARIKGEFASVAIEDTGLGMSSEDMKIVFSRFFRAEDSYVRKTTGTGLGLSIAKATIERHNGDIKVESKLGAGSKFEV